MPSGSPELHILCGKIASGKSTLAARLSAKPDTVLITEDAWLNALFGEEMQTREDYVSCSRRIKAAMKPHVTTLLRAGVSIVLDFPANTPGQRRWFREIIETTGVAHVLHVLDVSDEVCLARLRARNSSGDHPFVVTDSLFHEVTSYFTEPAADEGFTILRHGDEAETTTAPAP
ncbi:ATP-binding protein [Roseibacterium sp. SDUM158017]|uniref:AAA family ATPase n=1 Tax=Roseicyclus salinarum TaxID=3036773 RepID=UPI002414DDAF|nr:ATP-binding protein [Roseibacterium sp. SDUM158017]MDG4650391.1 ATP-binding protein [Roseibacterium sp. SDUM158017]